MNTEHRERIKREFLEHIGRVITRNRENRGMLQEVLGKEVGVSGSAISRYEYGEGNITAAMMAYISVELGFPLSEYIEYYEFTDGGEKSHISIDQVLKTLVLASESEKPKGKAFPEQNISGSKLNKDTNQYEFSFTDTKTKTMSNIVKQYDTASNAGAMLCEYMMHDNTGATEIMRFMYSIIQRQGNNGISQPLKVLISAVLDYVDSILADKVRGYYRAYISEISKNRY